MALQRVLVQIEQLPLAGAGGEIDIGFEADGDAGQLPV